MNGIIYILSHESMPNLLKIGYTTRSIKERVKELESTGVPGKFTIEIYFEIENASAFEMLLHKALHEYRFEKEFFKTDMKTAIYAINNLLDKNKKHTYIFKGKSSSNAMTKEQLDHQRILGQEKSERLAKKANELRDKYINKSHEELRVIAINLLDQCTVATLAEAKYVLRMRSKMLTEFSESAQKYYEASEEYKAAQKNKSIFDTEISEKLRNLGIEVNKILISTSQLKSNISGKIIYDLLGRGFEAGKKKSKELSNSQKKIILDFQLLLDKAENLIGKECLDYLSWNYSNKKYNFLLTNDARDVTDYFKGIVSGCKP